MSANSIGSCSICLNPLGPSYVLQDPEDGPTNYVTVDLHKTASGVTHKVHRICIWDWFQEQIGNERPGKSPSDLNDIPFSCPLCRERISLQDANTAAGTSLEKSIEITRRLKITSPF